MNKPCLYAGEVRLFAELLPHREFDDYSVKNLLQQCAILCFLAKREDTIAQVTRSALQYICTYGKDRGDPAYRAIFAPLVTTLALPAAPGTVMPEIWQSLEFDVKKRTSVFDIDEAKKELARYDMHIESLAPRTYLIRCPPQANPPWSVTLVFKKGAYRYVPTVAAPKVSPTIVYNAMAADRMLPIVIELTRSVPLSPTRIRATDAKSLPGH